MPHHPAVDGVPLTEQQQQGQQPWLPAAARTRYQQQWQLRLQQQQQQQQQQQWQQRQRQQQALHRGGSIAAATVAAAQHGIAPQTFAHTSRSQQQQQWQQQQQRRQQQAAKAARQPDRDTAAAAFEQRGAALHNWPPADPSARNVGKVAQLANATVKALSPGISAMFVKVIGPELTSRVVDVIGAWAACHAGCSGRDCVFSQSTNLSSSTAT